MTQRLTALIASAGALVLIAACGSSGGSAPSTPSQPSTTTSTGAAADVTLHQTTSFGNVLADPAGRTLYLLTSDGATLACTGGCLSLWKPLKLPHGATPKAGPGVTGTLGVVSRGSDQQITISRHPLYTYTGDSGPGDTTGQGIHSFNGTWYVVAPGGSPVTSSGANSSPSSSGGGGGYGY
jgi:predicted lipoprotein with Yx(FWY)xxD motif